MDEATWGGSFQKMRQVGSPPKREHLEMAHIAALQKEQRQNERLNGANDEMRRDLPYNRSDHYSNVPQYYHYHSGLETAHPKEATVKDMHQTFLLSNQGTYPGKLPQKDQSGGSQNGPTGETNKHEANSQMNPMQKLSKNCLIDSYPKDEPSDCEKGTEYNSAQNILSAFENGAYVNSEQTLPPEGTNSDVYFTREALNSMSTISYQHNDYPPRGEDPALVNTGTHIFSDKRDALTHDGEKLLMYQPRGGNTHLSNESITPCTRRQNAASIWGHTILKEQPRDEKTAYYSYEVKGEAEMCDTLKGYKNNGPNVRSVNMKADVKMRQPVNSSLADCPNGDLLCANKTTMGSENIKRHLHHPLNDSVLSNGHVVHEEDSQKVASTSKKIMTRNWAGNEEEANNGAFIPLGENTQMGHFKRAEVQPHDFFHANYNTCALSRSNLRDDPADPIYDNTHYYNDHVNGTPLNGGPNGYGLRQSKRRVLHVGGSRNVGTPSCKDDPSHEVKSPSVTTLPDQRTTPKTAIFNGEDEQNMSEPTYTQKMNQARGIFEDSPQHTSGKNYLSRFVQSDYEMGKMGKMDQMDQLNQMDEIRSCIPERPLYGNQNYDVPQIIQGITTKQKNGIVAECNQDTVIEYNDKWRLVKGKQFAINQADNFKSVEDSATYFQNYLNEHNENTKRMLTRINFNSLTGKFVINSLRDADGNAAGGDVRQLNRVYDYKDTLRSYPAYYGISQHMHSGTKEALKCGGEKGGGVFQNDHHSDGKNVHEQMRKKKSVGKKPNIALCGAGGGDYQLKKRIKDFVSQKMSDYFNVNFV
ncbi:unnamed protein product [Plasmodium vivax]|uniref:(malaria parasite P. vivax) hypothetical protein n=1 Tax=Plasmodium vivax TaxID=5855 RepID=A0A1G4H1Z8_PLAVI|nr:unnamed protein product [Plasmodium vivax]SCO68878.1 conserved Plasmodium protein, unknown function [Plasmodium vivax]